MGGCKSTAPEIARPAVSGAGTTVDIPPRRQLAPVAFDSTLVDLRRGADIGGYKFVPYECISTNSKLTWDSGRVGDSDPEIRTEIERTLFDRGLNVPGGAGELFQGTQRGAEDPAFFLGAKVKDVKAAICAGMDAWNGGWNGEQSGETLLDIEWQLYSVFEDRVVFQKTAKGYFEISEPRRTDGILFDLIVGAMASSAHDLTFDPEFIDALRRGGQASAASAQAPAAGPAVRIDRQPLFQGPLSNRIGRIRESVVVVRSGRGHGSGFLIAPTLIVTNQHVVGGSREALIEFADGRTDRVAVLARDSNRDVALLELQTERGDPLPIRRSDLKLTEDVFAIGAPLDRSLSGTVTRGIVSNFVQNRFGLVEIQADVDIQSGNSGGALLDSSGNVVGITYAAISSSRDAATSIGVNFFIPIVDGLDHLNVSLR